MVIKWRERRQKRSRKKRGVKGGWRLPLTYHEDGRHVMIVNAEQIGSGGKEEWLGGGG